MTESMHGEMPLKDYLEEEKGEIILYQPGNNVKIEVLLHAFTVWLSQKQITELFQTTRNNVTIHIRNIFKEGELIENSVCKDYLHTADDGKNYWTKYYNLDVIISVGYRVKSQIGTKFRIWANGVLKEYMMRGIAIHQRVENLEQHAIITDQRIEKTQKQLDFYIQTDLPRKEGVFFDGQVFDAYVFVANLVKSARKSIILIDNYIDETILLLLAKRETGVMATIYTETISTTLSLDLQKHNLQYTPVNLKTCKTIHDRFLIIDDVIYHIGASFKDLGKKLFAFSKMGLSVAALMKNIN